MKFEAVIENRRVEVVDLGEGVFQVNGKKCHVDVCVLESGLYSLIIDGASYEVAVRDEKRNSVVEVGAHLIPVKLEDPFTSKSTKGKDAIEGAVTLASPMPGRVVSIKVEVGSDVKEGAGVIVVEAMKMENELHAPKTGKIKSVHVKVGDAVESGQDLVVIE